MKLSRARPVQRVTLCMPVAEEQELEDVLLYDFHNLRGFTEAVILGENTSSYNKGLLKEYIREVVYRKKTAELIENLDERLRSTIQTMLGSFDNIEQEAAQQGMDVDARNNQLFDRVERSWCHLRTALGDLIQLCSPLEAASCGKFSLWVTAMKYYKEQLDTKELLYDRVMTVMLDKVTEYRDGKDLVFCQLRNMVEMLTFVQSYDIFEERLLAETRTYYREFIANVLSQNSLYDHCLTFQKKINHEEGCCRMYLLKSSVAKLMDTVRMHILQLNSSSLMNEAELKRIINERDVKTMSVLLDLYGSTNWEGQLHDAIFMAAKSIGDDLVSKFIATNNDASNKLTAKDHEKFVGELQELKNSMDITIKNQMPASVDYKTREHGIWTKVLNCSPEICERVTFALASYADGEPHESPMYALSSDEGNSGFVMHLFRSLSGKPYFEEALRGLLSRRLLYSQEINNYHVNLVNSLKEECGTSYVAKLEALIADHQSSTQYNRDYKQAFSVDITMDQEQDLKFSVLVVSTDSWVTKAQLARPELEEAFIECEVEGVAIDTTPHGFVADPLTDTIRAKQHHFSEFYRTRFKNRSISYFPDLGSSVLQMELKGEIYDLKLSACQAYCLLAFNTMDSISLDSMSYIMGKEYNETIVRRQLAALNSGSSPLLLFKRAELNFENCAIRDQFELNQEFTCPERFCDLQHKELTFEKEHSVIQRGNTIEDMTPSVEATIVRHMKSTLNDTTTTLFRICSEKFKLLDRFAFNKILDSLEDRDFLSVDHKTQKVLYVP